MACLDRAHKEILKIMKSNGYDMRTTEAKEIFLLADRMLNNIDEVIPDDTTRVAVEDIVYKIRQSPIQGLAPSDYWGNVISNFANGGEVTVLTPSGGRFTGKVETSSLNEDGRLLVNVVSGNNRSYNYEINPNTGLATDGSTIEEFSNIYNILGNEFGSRDNIEFDDSRFTLLEHNINNDIRKARNLVKELDLLDRTAITTEHRNHLDMILDTFIDATKEYIPDTKVYLNDRATENGGKLKFNRKRGAIYLNAGQRDQQFAHDPSMREIFTHEIVHSAVEFGREFNRAEVAGTMSRVRRLHRQFLERFTAEDLVPVDSQYPYETELANARELYTYMSSTNGVSEFIAHGLTNPQVISRLRELDYYERGSRTPENMFEKIIQFVQEFFNTVFARFRQEQGASGDELLLKFSLALAESNNKAVNKAKVGVTARIIDTIDVGNSIIRGMTDKSIEYISSRAGDITLPGTDATRKERFLFVSKNMGLFLFDKRLRPYLERFISDVFGQRPEGTIQSIIRGFRTPDRVERVIERMGRLSSTIDQERKVKENSMINAILQSFDKIPTKEELTALGSVVVENDLGSIADIGINRIREVLANQESLTQEIGSTESVIDSLASRDADRNYYKNMAEKLGYFMVTSKGDELTLMNARNIVRKLNDPISGRPETIDEELVTAVDKLASLYAISYSEVDSRNTVADLIDRESVGVQSLMALQVGLRQSSAAILDSNGVFEVKGYTRDVTDRKKDVRVALLEEQDDLESEGYELVERLRGSNNDSTAGRFGLFVSDSFSVQPYNRTAMRLGSNRKVGTSIRDAHFAASSIRGAASAELDIDKIRVANESKVASLYARRQPGVTDVGLVPLFNPEGEIVDYRYIMTKENKAKYLDRDSDAALMLGKASGALYDKSTSKEFNSKLLDIAIEEMRRNFNGGKFGEDGKEYVIISRTSSNEEAREIFRLLPDDLRQEIRTKLGDEPLAVRRDQLYSYFGYRNISTVDSAIGRRVIGNKVYRDRLRVGEEVWKDMVAISKVDIVIKTPAVLIGNIISNLVLSVQLGMNPLDVGRLQLEGVAELKRFRASSKELAELEARQQGGLTSAKEDNRIRAIRGELDKSPVKDLTDEGLFQSIIEDITPDQNSNNNSVTSKVNEFLSGTNQYVRDGIGWVYLTERNPLFKTMLTATQYSDFVARYGLYQSLRARGVSRPRAITRVNDAFINYGIPDSKILQYLNDIGLVMFTKYFMRIQRVIRDGVAEKPLNFLLALIGQEYLVGDIEDVTDQSIFDKDLTNVIHSPFEHLKNMVIPSGLEIADSLYDRLS